MNVSKKTKICLAMGMCAVLCGAPISKSISTHEKLYNANEDSVIKGTGKSENTKSSKENDTESNIILDASKFDYDESRNLYKITEKVDSINGIIKEDLTDISSLSYSVTDDKGIVVKEGKIDAKEEWNISDIGFVLGKNNLTITAEKNEEEIIDTIVVYNESYDNVDNLSVDMSDSDNDGLINYWEDYFETDKDNIDTDGDGVSDIDEITKLGTDPLKVDTSGNGINDGDEDFDEDGLTNKQEMEYGTDAYLADSDSDSLSDYDEIHKYKTNPIIADTDGDGAVDGLEVENEYNPLSKDEYFTMTVISNDEKAKLYSNTIKGSDIENFNIEVLKELILENVAGAKTEIYKLGYNSEAQISIEYSAKSEEENPLIYEYDEETQGLTALETSADDKYLTAKTSCREKVLYIVIDQYEYEASMVQAFDDEIDDGTDSNNDGITDKDTLKMVNGELLTNCWTKVFGDATYEEIQANDDFDKDGIINGKEIEIKKDKCGRRYVELKSSPAAYDTDNDGIPDGKDTAPFTRGLKDGIVGTVQIYSRHNPEEAFYMGHAFLVFTSYVNDETLTIKNINRSYLYDKEKDTYVLKDGDFDTHTLQRGEYVSIGNYRSQGLDVMYDSASKNYEALWIDSGLNEYLDRETMTMVDIIKFALSKNAADLIDKNIKSLTGPSIRFNEEIHCTYAYEGFTQYPNAVLKKEVTKEQLDKITKFAESNNHYNLLVNNCSTIATGGWNLAFNDKLLPRKKYGLYAMIDTPMILKSHILEKEGAEVDVKTFGVTVE